MKTSRLVAAGVSIALLAACEGGGIDLNVSTTDNSVDNSTTTTPPPTDGGSSNPCASYTPAGSTTVRRGTFDGRNCVYSSAFVGLANPLTVNVTIPFISGVHIFQDSLVVGTNVASGAAPAGGTGPRLTIEAGNTLAFSDSGDYVLINRGSQIIANGSPAAPITFTAFADAVSGTAGANDVQLWGGMVINGNGITNNCTDAQRAANQCHVVSEGQPSNYGGNSNTESSGTLRYVILKHTGFEVAPNDELNGITFNAVGSGTVVENIQVYSTYDDGLEFFGGAVNVRNAVLLYVRDDSLDFSDGYQGTIQNALAIQWQTDGNRCIETDNVGEARSTAGAPLDTPPLTKPVVRNLTCIMSNFDTGTHGGSEGSMLRQGGRMDIANSIIFSGYGIAANGDATPTNRCYRLDSTVSQAAAVAGNSQVDNTIIACTTPSSGNIQGSDTLLSWLQGANPSAGGANYSFNANNSIITTPNGAGVAVLEPGTFYTSTALNNGTAPITFPTGTGQIGAVTRAADWTSPWAFGLRESNADRKLWFAP